MCRVTYIYEYIHVSSLEYLLLLAVFQIVALRVNTTILGHAWMKESLGQSLARPIPHSGWKGKNVQGRIQVHKVRESGDWAWVQRIHPPG